MKWNVTCACGCNLFDDEKNVYVVTSDLDDPHGELIVMANCMECGKRQAVV